VAAANRSGHDTKIRTPLDPAANGGVFVWRAGACDGTLKYVIGAV
jgi:hypothetical protein